MPFSVARNSSASAADFAVSFLLGHPKDQWVGCQPVVRCALLVDVLFLYCCHLSSNTSSLLLCFDDIACLQIAGGAALFDNVLLQYIVRDSYSQCVLLQGRFHLQQYSWSQGCLWKTLRQIKLHLSDWPIKDRSVKVQHLSHRGPRGNSVSNGIFRAMLSYPSESLSDSNLCCFLFYSITKKLLFSEKYSCFVLIIRWLLRCGQKQAWKQRASELQTLGSW